MQRWKEEFVANTTRKCVHVHHNGDFERGKVLYMEPDWTYLDFLNAASHRLNMVPVAKRAFNADGVEIDDCMMIEDDDILFLSIKEDFIAPFDHLTEHSDLDNGGRPETEKVPSIVGGYKVGELLGRGGFGEVRVAEHHLTGERVALKFLRKSEIHSFNAAERTNTEIQCLTALKHANIIRLQQHMESSNHVVLVFELMEGGDLLKYLIRRKQEGIRSKMNLTEDEARIVFYQVLSAVSYAHNQHICHRDLKLENILLKDSSLSCVKIADFGLSAFYRPGSLVKSSCGTLSFLAPEVFRGTANAGPPLDVWSLGVILFALLSGRLPFEGPDLIGTKRPRDAVIKARIMKCQFKLDEQLSPEAKDLVRRMLQLDPAERMTIPEIFTHVWVRAATSNHWMMEPAPTALTNNTSNNFSNNSNTNNNTNTILRESDLNNSNNNNNNNIDFFSPFSIPKTKRGHSNPTELTSFPQEYRMRKDSSHSEVSTAFNSKQSSRTDLDRDLVPSGSTPARPARSRSSDDMSDLVKEIEAIQEHEENHSHTQSSTPVTTATTLSEPKSTIKLVPLRRHHDGGKASKAIEDDDILFTSVGRLSDSGSKDHYRPNTSTIQNGSSSNSNTNGGGRRGLGLGLAKPTREECSSPSLSIVSSPNTAVKPSTYGKEKDNGRANSPRIDMSDQKDRDSLYLLTMQSSGAKSSSTTTAPNTSATTGGYSTENRKPSVPSVLGTSSTEISPNPKSHPASAGIHRSRDVGPVHTRQIIPAGLASLHYGSVLKPNNGLSPSSLHHDLSNTSSPIASPLFTNVKKTHSYQSHSPGQNGMKDRFN